MIDGDGLRLDSVEGTVIYSCIVGRWDDPRHLTATAAEGRFTHVLFTDDAASTSAP